MLKYDRLTYLPSAAELPDSDDKPVDNELQNLIPNLLEAILSLAWAERGDWFFGVDMGIYYAPNKPAIVPDGFLSLGVKRVISKEGRLSYVLWEENEIVPILALEVISKTYGGEYEEKQNIYAELGILYYIVYFPNRPKRSKKPAFKVYQLIEDKYVSLEGEPVWLPEIGLAIGRDEGTYLARTREWLYWYDRQGNRLPTQEELTIQQQQRAVQAEQRAAQVEQQAEIERQRADRLAAKLREMGIDPEN